MTDRGFDTLAEYVEAELEFATSHYTDSYLERRFASRMRRSDVDDYDAYLELLQGDDQEAAALLDSLSINVTGFFRNPEVWDGIRERLRELFDAAGSRDVVRVWSAACADGREAYSLSMLVHDDDGCDPDRLEVVATDINEQALEQARTGIYRSTRTVDVVEQLEYLSEYDRFVERSGDRFRIRDAVREPVTFERHDLISDPPKEAVDLAICRNLFIYIDNECKEPVLSTLASATRTGGYLAIGKAETVPPHLQQEFEPADTRLRIYRRT